MKKSIFLFMVFIAVASCSNPVDIDYPQPDTNDISLLVYLSNNYKIVASSDEYLLPHESYQFEHGIVWQKNYLKGKNPLEVIDVTLPGLTVEEGIALYACFDGRLSNVLEGSTALDGEFASYSIDTVERGGSLKRFRLENWEEKLVLTRRRIGLALHYEKVAE